MYYTPPMTSRRFSGPTFEEMLDPGRIDAGVREKALEAQESDPLDPVNLYNIGWTGPDGRIRYEVLPSELTRVEAPIVALHSVDFPTGSHKVGAAYAVAVEMALNGDLDPTRHTLVWPSTGNYGIGGAWVGGRMGFSSVVVLPEGMSRERFDQIESYGASLIKTPGTESNVKEVYDKVRELQTDPGVRVMNQFELMGNYRFHYAVTGNTGIALAAELGKNGVGNGRLAAFVSAMGSAGTIAAGDRLKQEWDDLKIVGAEPIQCSTLFNNGYGAHEIQGIGDKHVTWIHHVTNMDAIVCVDDSDCLKGLQLLTAKTGIEVLSQRCGIPHERTAAMARIFGISGVANVLAAIKTAKFYGFGSSQPILTVCTDAVDRYGSVMSEMPDRFGVMDDVEARRRTHIFSNQTTDWIKEGTPEVRRGWHNLKYFTWVEQQGKSVEDLDAQLDEAWWRAEQDRVPEIDDRIRSNRSS